MKTTTCSAGLTLASHQWCPFYNEVFTQPLGQMSGCLTQGHDGAEMVRHFLREIKYTMRERVRFSMRWYCFHTINRFFEYVWCLFQRQSGNIFGICNGCFHSFRVTLTQWQWVDALPGAPDQQEYKIYWNTCRKVQVGRWQDSNTGMQTHDISPQNLRRQERSPGNNM